MNRKNARQSADEILQNEFTAYFVKAVRRHKCQYIRRKDLRRQAELLTIDDSVPEMPTDVELLEGFHIMQQIENEALYRAIRDVRENSAAILFMRAIEEMGFSEIAETLHMNEPAVKAIYYRLVQKLQKTMRDKNHADRTIVKGRDI